MSLVEWNKGLKVDSGPKLSAEDDPAGQTFPNIERFALISAN